MKVFVFFQRCAFKERKQQLDWDGLEAEIDQSFPHGFITTKLFPASFCELGIERFRAELLALPGSVRDAVISSLRQRVAEHGLQYVLPKSLAAII
jgi:hypothetical protein